MKKELSVLLFLCILKMADAQIMFQKMLKPAGTIENYANVVFQKSDGGYIIEANDTPYQKTMLIRLNSSGDTMWMKTYSGRGFDMKETSDGGYIIVGMITITVGYPSLFFLKTDSTGNVQWAKNVEGIGAYINASVCLANDGGYVATGRYLNGSTPSKTTLIKINSAGTLQWSKFYSIANLRLWGESIVTNNSGGYIIAGSVSDTLNNNSHMFFMNTDSSGIPVWSKLIGTNGTDYADHIRKTNDNGYIVAGRCHPTNYYSNLLIKFDSAFSIQWDKAYSRMSYTGQVAQTNDGGYITASGDTLNGFYLIKTNNVGDTIWTREFGFGSQLQYVFHIEQTNENGYIISCYNGTFSATGNIYIVKTDSIGTALCNNRNIVPTVSSPLLTVSTLVISTTVGDTCTTFYPVVTQGGWDSTFCSANLITKIQPLILSEETISISPNPFSNSTTISIQSPINNSQSTIVITDVLGKEIKTIRFSGKQYILEKGELNAGIYFIQLTDENKNSINKKIIIQ